jgi:hypothetical protein
MTQPSVTYHVNVVKGGHTWLTLLVAVYVGMMVMFTLIALAANVFVTVVALMVTMYVVIALIVYKGTYTLDESGIHESLVPYVSLFNLKKAQDRHFTWQQVGAYKLSEDASRYDLDFSKANQKVIFTLYLKDPTYKIVFNNGKTAATKAAFGLFIKEFLAKVEDVNRTGTPYVTAGPARYLAEAEDGPVIRRKKSFYEKPIAKLVTILFIVFTIGLVSFMIQGYGSATNWFKLLFLIVPGTLYMAYRSFLMPRRNK